MSDWSDVAWFWRLLVAAVLFGLAASRMPAQESAILPASFKLSGPFSRQQLILEALRDKQFIGQITNDVLFTSSDPKIIRIEGDMASPVTNGTATVTAKSGDLTATAEAI